MTKRRFRVDIVGAGEAAEVAVSYDNVAEITTIDANSHGTGPLGNLTTLATGDRRLIVSSPNVLAVTIEPYLTSDE